MKLTEMTQNELNLLSYTEIAYRYLKENKVTLKIPDLFKQVCKLLDFNDTQYANKIGDFYTSITMDKRFIVLENNEWDLRANHSVELVVDDDDADLSEEPLEDEEVEGENEENEDNIDADLDDADDDLDDLTIIDGDETVE